MPHLVISRDMACNVQIAACDAPVSYYNQLDRMLLLRGGYGVTVEAVYLTYCMFGTLYVVQEQTPLSKRGGTCSRTRGIRNSASVGI